MTQTTSDVSALRAAMTGAVLEPGDEGYDDARDVWNADIDRRPAVIARCTGPDDVAAALAHAQSAGLRVAVRGGGHGYWGAAVPEGGLMIDLSPLDACRSTRRPAGALRRRRQLGAARRGHPGARSRRHRGHGQPHRRRRPDARRRLRLAHLELRADDRQPGVGRGRAGRRALRAGERDRAPGPVLGAAWRWWQLRRRHRVRVPAAPGRPDRAARPSVRRAGPGRAGAPDRARRVPRSCPRGSSLAIVCNNAPPAPFVPESYHFAPGVALIVVGFGTPEEHAAAIAPLREALSPRSTRRCRCRTSRCSRCSTRPCSGASAPTPRGSTSTTSPMRRPRSSRSGPVDAGRRCPRY